MIPSFHCDKNSAIAHTADGLLRGFEFGGIYTFWGVRYASARRFEQPEPVKPWEGVRTALTRGYNAPLMERPRLEGNNEIYMMHRYWPESEHCQYLNVWTPGLNDKKRPVLVWLHGGAFETGSNMEMECYDGDRLAATQDCVVVGINHRLNMLGFLDLSAYGEKYRNSGNCGLADIVEALRWVRRNIAAFGGDPDRVTIFGQSGGGGKVCALQQTPAADGLFSAGIVQSGVLTSNFSCGTDKRIADYLVAELQKEGHPLEEIQTVSVETLFAAFRKIRPELQAQGIPAIWAPVPNDYYLGDALQVGIRPHAATIPMIIGTVYGDFSMNPDFTMQDVEALHGLDAAGVRAAMAGRFGEEHADELLRLYQEAYPDHALCDAASADQLFRVPTLNYLALRAEQATAPTWAYVFAYNLPIDGGRPAWHCTDIPFAFAQTEKMPYACEPGVSDRLEAQVSGAWAALARNGDPNHEGLPTWTPYSAPSRSCMVFDRESKVRDHDFDRTLAEAAQAWAPRIGG